jgi:CRISPR/Cas system CSM-associated protein Csm3 (group 7 of RAMP superfamily)
VTVLGFTVTFHAAFRVGAAAARDGTQAPVDRDDPLPADHLKGIMRAVAVDLLGHRDHWAVGEVFGTTTAPSPWSWSSAEPSVGGEWEFGSRHRVAIDSGTHSARKDQLVRAEQAWTEEARFTVAQTGVLDSADEAIHILVLRCAAAGAHGLGGWRRRGLGWVGIAPDAPITAADVRALRAIASTRAADTAVIDTGAAEAAR